MTRQLTIHQHYELDGYLFLCTKMRPESSELYLWCEGLYLWVDEDTGRLHPAFRREPGLSPGIFPFPTTHTVDDLIERDDVECWLISPSDPGVWIDPECTAPNMLNIPMPLEIEDELREFLGVQNDH